MTTLKQGDLIKEPNGYKRKVMEVFGTILFISGHSDHDLYDFITTEPALKACDYTWDTPAWEPKNGEMYWYISINEDADVLVATWRDYLADHSRRDFLGIYKTSVLGEAALLEIRRKLGK